MSLKTDAEKRHEASVAANKTKEVVTEMKAGHAPKNEVVIEGIDKAKISLEARKADPRVDAKGHVMIDHTKEVLDATKEFIQTKNAHGEIQTMLEGAGHEAKVAREKKAAKSRPSLDPAEKKARNEKAKGNAKQVGSFLKLLVTDAEFRSLFGDLVNYVQEMHNSGMKERAKHMDLSKDPRIAAREIKEMAKEEHKVAAESDKVPDSDEVYKKLQVIMQKLAANPAFLNATRSLLAASGRMYAKLDRTPHYEMKYYPETTTRTSFYSTVPVPGVPTSSTGVATTTRVETTVPTGTAVPVIAEVKPHDAHHKSAEADAAAKAGKRLIENVTNDYSLDAIISAAKDLGRKIKADPEANRLAKDLYYHLEEQLNRPELITDETYHKNTCKPLYERVKQLYKKYEFSREMDIIIHESQQMLHDFKNDTVVTRLQHSIKTLADDLFTRDASGRPHLNEGAMEQVRSVLIPLFAEQLKYIGIPRIEIHDEKMDAWFDNLAVSFYELLPNQVDIKTSSNTKINLKDLGMKLDGYLKIVLSDIKLNLKDVKFMIDRHKAPKLKSEGTVDICTKGTKGIHIVARFGILKREGKALPELDTATVQVTYMPGIKIKFHKDADHHGLLNFGTSIAGSTVKAKVKQAIELKMTEMFNGIRTKLNNVIAHSTGAAPIATKMEAAKAVIKDSDFHEHMVKENEKKSM